MSAEQGPAIGHSDPECTCADFAKGGLTCGARAVWEGETPSGGTVRRCANHPPYALLLSVTKGGRSLV